MGVSEPRRKRLVVIGNGMAGIRTVEELLGLDAQRFEITVFSAEPHGNYNRILLSPVLAGEKRFDDIVTHPREWYASNGITLHAGDPVVAIDRKRRVVHARSGLDVPYDRLLLATGSKPFVIPVPGHQLPGVIAFRDIHDVESMLEAARNHRHAVVIGGGLLGLEAANGLARRGMTVTVVHVMDSLMERQLDKPAAGLLKTALESRGIRFLLEANTAEILGSDRVTGLRFKDGGVIDADLVVMAVGIRPNFELAKAAGLHCERALVVDDTLQSLSDPRIYAVGECVQHRKSTYGLVAPLYEQAQVCAAHLAGLGHRRYPGSVTSTKLKVTGIDLFSAGDFIGDAETQDLVFRDPRRGVYKRLVLKGPRLVGVVLYGDVKDGPWYFELMQKRTSILPFRSRLLFGQAYCEPSEQAA
ncbi:MAG: NAD(P)/FAD-dependent oxidoreductase [Panacagrimonas sp.]|nr:FAD-dependent oxidoreductase [Panacagrimonas sp.]MCC2656775.1 NAD(P)/FAD-dependent oxidoreductase [Panacagrimonas sp.]